MIKSDGFRALGVKTLRLNKLDSDYDVKLVTL